MKYAHDVVAHYIKFAQNVFVTKPTNFDITVLEHVPCNSQLIGKYKSRIGQTLLYYKQLTGLIRVNYGKLLQGLRRYLT